jgi:Phage tail tube protein
MAYVSSNNNRFYVALEGAYGAAAAITAQSRIPAVKLTAKQTPEKINRQDKTGSRTFVGLPTGLRKSTTFDLRSYMSAWPTDAAAPPHDPLFQACLGGPALSWAGATISSASSGSALAFAAPHGLTPGQAVTSGGEIRFVAAVPDASSIVLNAPLSELPPSGTALGRTLTYTPGPLLGSLSIFDYWTPGDAVQRVFSGAAVNQFQVKVNGDIHEFEFSGQAADVLDSSSFESGEAALTGFPIEPDIADSNFTIIPGNLGQMWIGSSPSEFLTVTSAQLTFSNQLDLRADEFGSTLARSVVPGIRQVMLNFNIYQQDDTATQALYQAARQQSPVSVMLQLGEQAGQMFGIYMSSVVLQVPQFDDADKRQQWQFENCRAQGDVDDEIFIAFA